MFSEKAIAQMAAFFTGKEGGQIQVLKLMKLLYLAERESLDQHGHPISFDKMVAMDNGPVLSRTLNYLNGFIESGQDGWDSWLRDREAHGVSLARQPNREALTELSDANLEVLETVWRKFGHMDKWQIRDYTHDRCAEWRYPQGGSYPIHYQDVFTALGKAEHAEELTENLKKFYRVERIFARL